MDMLGVDSIVQSPTTINHSDLMNPGLPHDENSSSSHPHDLPFQTAVANANRRRKSLKGPVGSVIKRSASSPNVRGMSAASESAAALAEKRRNKLGYHRTSVACVHCRRRKIRCLLAPDDAQNRCSNCIRLKKECNFYPVDQQPPVERRPRAGSKAEGRSGDTSASSSSSPSMTTGHVVDQVDQYGQYPMMPLGNHSYSGSVVGLGTTTLSPPGSAAPIASQFEFPESENRVNWEPPYYDGPPMQPGQSIPEDPQGRYWKISESPMAPTFPPNYTPAAPTTMAHQVRDVNGSYASYSPPKPEPGWQPQRSMSYSHLEDLHHGPDSFNQFYQQDSRRSTSDMLPPSLRNSARSSTASMSETPTLPLSGPGSAQPMYHYGLPQSWNTLPNHSPKTSVGFDGWYPDPGQLSKVQEEEVPHFVGDSAIMYSAGQH